MAPNHAETQGARRDMKACGPWKGSGGGTAPLHSFLLPSDLLVSSSRFLFGSRPFSSNNLHPSTRLCSDIINLSLPSPTPHRGPQTRDPAAERLGDRSYRLSSPRFRFFMSIYLNVLVRIASYHIGYYLLPSHRLRSALLSPSPAMARRELGGRIGSLQLESDHITFYLNASDRLGSDRFISAQIGLIFSLS
jgi:hypothetical protein